MGGGYGVRVCRGRLMKGRKGSMKGEGMYR